jgi:predicted branched-subunit amino acid permease
VSEADLIADAGPPIGGISLLDMAAMFVSALAIGIAVAPIMVDVGTPNLVVMLAATFAWSGTGMVAYASVIGAGGSMAPALVAAMLVSSRFALLAMSLKDRWPASLAERIGMYHTASEVAVASAIDQGREIGPHAARRVFWQLVVAMMSGWIIGSGIGVALGNFIGDTRALGLDAVFPASFIGSVVNGLTRRDTAVAVVGGAGAALGLTPFLPAGLPVLIAAAAAGLGLLVRPSRP